MASTYNPAKDPTLGWRNANGNTPMANGRKMRPITPHDVNNLDPYAKAIEVTAAGNLVIIPVENDDTVTIPYTNCPVGFRPGCIVRRVLATGTTATVVAIDG